MEIIKVAIVDDHDMVRRGLCAFLGTQDGIELVGEASSGREAVELARKTRPDVILMDLLMEEGCGIEATREILAFHAGCKIIILTSYYDDDQVFPALEAGAYSYLLKTARGEEIKATIHKAVKGEAVIAPKVAAKMAGRLRLKSRMAHEELTPREREVLILIGKGKSNQEIGDELFIGIKTVKTHVSSILAKLQVQDRTQAAIYANRCGLVDRTD